MDKVIEVADNTTVAERKESILNFVMAFLISSLALKVFLL
jgi:hypothetical protein